MLLYIILICTFPIYNSNQNVFASKNIIKPTREHQSDDTKVITDISFHLTEEFEPEGNEQTNNENDLFEHHDLVSYGKNVDKQNIEKDLNGSNNNLLNYDNKTPKHSLRDYFNQFSFYSKDIENILSRRRRKRHSPKSDNADDDTNKISKSDDVATLANKDRIDIKHIVKNLAESDKKISNYTQNDVNNSKIITFDSLNKNDSDRNPFGYRSNKNGDNIKSNLTKNQTNFISHNRTNYIVYNNKIQATSNFVESVFGKTQNEKPKEEGRLGWRPSKVQRDVQHKQQRNVDEFVAEEPVALPLRPIIRGPFDQDEQNPDEVQIIYVEPQSPIKLNCEVDLDIMSSVWMKDGQIVQAKDKSARSNDYRFIREPRGSLTITNVMLEDDGYWQCEAENFRGYVENGRPIKLTVLNPPKPPYLLFESRRLDAGNMFIPVKENTELPLSCVSESGNPKPLLSWELLLSPGIDRHAQKLSPDRLEIQVLKNEKEKEIYKMNAGARSDAKIPVVYRAHHNARILCVMEHPSLKIRQNASILLDVQYSPSFAITRVPGFGYPLREGLEVSLKCDVDSNPPATAMWQKDDQDPPIPQTGDGYLNFSSIRREHSGWYKCTSRYLNSQYSSIGYYLSVRYDALDVTSDPVEQELAMSSSSSLSSSYGNHSSHNPFKFGQLEVELGGSITIQCPQGSLGCWSHLDPITSRLRGLGDRGSLPTGQYNLKDAIYQDAGVYKCVGQSAGNGKKKVEILHSVSVSVRGAPTIEAKNPNPIAYAGSPLHLSVEFCANPPAYAARWLHGERVYTPGKQYGADVLAYGFVDLPTPFCKEARLTYVHMHDKVPRTFYFIVSSPSGVAEAVFNVNFTIKNRRINNNNLPNSIEEDEELAEPEEIQFPIFGSSANCIFNMPHYLIIVTITTKFILDLLLT